MVAGAFPIVKLGTLALRQISKPLANLLKSRAKGSPFFRTYVCMPPAQFYHWMEVNVKMKMLGLGKPSQVQKLNENAAIELGAELLGEVIIFVIASGTLIAEYMRQSRKAAAESAAVEERWINAEMRIEELEYTINKNNAEIRELSRHLFALQSSVKSLTPQNSDKDKDRGIIGKAIEDVTEKIGGKKK